MKIKLKKSLTDPEMIEITVLYPISRTWWIKL